MVDEIKGFAGGCEEWPERVDVGVDMSRKVVRVGMPGD